MSTGGRGGKQVLLCRWGPEGWVPGWHRECLLAPQVLLYLVSLVSLKRFEMFVILFLEIWGLSARMTPWVSLIIILAPQVLLYLLSLVSLKGFEIFVILFLETWGLSAGMTAWVSLIIIVIICNHRHCRPHNYRCLSALTQRSEVSRYPWGLFSCQHWYQCQKYQWYQSQRHFMTIWSKTVTGMYCKQELQTPGIWTAERAQHLFFLLSDVDNILPLSQWSLHHWKHWQGAMYSK